MVWQHQGWRDPNVQWLDIDEYDFYSKMICAFEQRFDYNAFAGGLRKVDSKNEAGHREIIEQIMRRKRYTFEETDLRQYKEIIKKNIISQYDLNELIPEQSPLHGLLEQNQMPISGLLETVFDSPRYEIEGRVLSEYALDENSRLCPLPAMKVHNKKGELDRFFEAIIREENDRVFTEGGRLGILPKYRGSYHGNMINERIAEESIARFVVEKVSDVLICCHPDQYRFFYKPLGFTPIEGVTEEKYYKLNAPSMAYRLDVRNFFDPGKVKAREVKRERISAYAEKIRKSIESPDRHASCMCSNLRDCLKEDYLVPLDIPVDYHCPLRVHRFLSPIN